MLNVSTTNNFVLIPGLSQTVTVPANSDVIIATDGSLSTNSIATNGFSIVDVVIFVDGTFVPDAGWKRVVAANTNGLIQMVASWSSQLALHLSPGAHTIQVAATFVGGSIAVVSGGNGSVQQGVLTVTILKR